VRGEDFLGDCYCPVASRAKLPTSVFTPKSVTQLQKSLAYAMEIVRDKSRELNVDLLICSRIMW